MRATGCIRKLDSLGRIVIPVQVRNNLKIGPGDDIELFVDREFIVLKKYIQPCIFCGQTEDIYKYKGNIICSTCMISLRCYDEIKHLYQK